MSTRVSMRTDAYITFRLARQLLGLPVARVQEVITGERIFRVPLVSDHIAGFLNLRGQIVTALDLRAALELGAPTRQGGMHVVVRDGDELFALVVDRVGDVLEVRADEVEPPPTTLDPVWKRCCEGVVRMESELLVLLRLDALLRSSGGAAG